MRTPVQVREALQDAEVEVRNSLERVQSFFAQDSEEVQQELDAYMRRVSDACLCSVWGGCCWACVHLAPAW